MKKQIDKKEFLKKLRDKYFPSYIYREELDPLANSKYIIPKIEYSMVINYFNFDYKGIIDNYRDIRHVTVQFNDDDDAEIHTLKDVADSFKIAFCRCDYVKASELLRNTLKRPISKNFRTRILIYTGELFKLSGNYVESLDCLNEAEEIGREEDVSIDDFYLWLMNHWKAWILITLGNFDRAKLHFNTALRICGKAQKPSDLDWLSSKTHANEAIMLYFLGDYEASEKKFRLSQQNSPELISNLSNLGYLYMMLSHFRQKEFYSNLAYFFFQQAHDAGFSNSALLSQNTAAWFFRFVIEEDLDLVKKLGREKEPDKSFAITNYSKAAKGYKMMNKPLDFLSCQFMNFIINKETDSDPIKELAGEMGTRLYYEWENPLTLVASNINAAEDLLLRKSKSKKETAHLHVLRRWNSYTPRIPVSHGNKGKGGGYFLQWEDSGIVIDPGFDFIENFYGQGFSLADINAILITHSHIDHIHDLPALITLLFERNERLKDLGEDVHMVYLLGNKEIMDRFNYATSSSGVSSKKFLRDYRKLFPSKDESYDLNKLARPIGLKLSIMKAKHATPTADPEECLCLKLEGEIKGAKISIGFTGDTGYKKELNKFFNSCDVLVTHLGEISFKEIATLTDFKIDDDDGNYIEGTAKNTNQFLRKLGFKTEAELKKAILSDKKVAIPTENGLLSNHLGLLGLVNLANTEIENKNKVIVISEFGEEMASVRHRIAKLLNSSNFSDKGHFFTGDIGFSIDLRKKRIRCNWCGKYVDQKKINEVNLKQNKNSVKYYCNDCAVNSNSPWANFDASLFPDNASNLY